MVHKMDLKVHLLVSSIALWPPLYTHLQYPLGLGTHCMMNIKVSSNSNSPADNPDGTPGLDWWLGKKDYLIMWSLRFGVAAPVKLALIV